MRKIITLSVIVLSLVISLAGTRISLLNFITADLLNAEFDYFPILYVNYSPGDGLEFRIVQYGSPYLTGDPNQYYLRYSSELPGIGFDLDLGKGRIKRTNTEELDLLRVGGLKYYFTGIGIHLEFSRFDLGGAYDITRNDYAVYALLNTNSVRLGVYYETKYNEISADIDAKLGGFNVWGAVSSDVNDLNVTYLLGGSLSVGDFDLAGQYVWKGSGYVDHVTGDPNEVSNLWCADLKLGYGKDLFGFKPNLWIKYNSKWFTDGEMPLSYLELSRGDLSIRIKFTGSDLDSNLPGDQAVLVKWKLFFDVIDTEKEVKGETGKPEIAKSVTALEIKSVEPPGLLKIKGIVTVPPSVLGKNQFYVSDPTGGILVYAPEGAPDLNVGDIVVIEGRYKLYYDMPEIVASSVEKTGQKAKRIPVKKLDRSPSREDLGNLVKVEGVVVRKGKVSFEVQVSKDLVLKIYIKKTTGINIREIREGDRVEVKGILYIYKKRFEILPRFPEDIVIK